jgi:hypothetical protein
MYLLGFKIYADARLTYDSLSRILNQQLSGMRIEGEKGVVKNKYVVIESASILPAAANRIAVKLKLRGSLEGTIFVSGQPIMDTTTRLITFKNLDYDVATRNLLVKSADWMLNKKITRKLNDAAHFDVKQYLNQLQAIMNNGLNRNLGRGMNTSGQMNRFAILDIIPQPDHLFVRMFANGRMQVTINELAF